jgi:hypothetical protein
VVSGFEGTEFEGWCSSEGEGGEGGDGVIVSFWVWRGEELR